MGEMENGPNPNGGVSSLRATGPEHQFQWTLKCNQKQFSHRMYKKIPKRRERVFCKENWRGGEEQSLEGDYQEGSPRRVVDCGRASWTLRQPTFLLI